MKKSTYQLNRQSIAIRRVACSAAVITAIASVPMVGHAATVTLTATDTSGNSSFTTGTRWSDGQVPSSVNGYVVPTALTLRTPADGASITFGGNSLTLGDNGASNAVLTLKNANNAIITINNFLLNKGSVQNGGTASGAATILTLASNGITIGSGGGTFDSGSAGRSINVSAPITGAGSLAIIGAGSIALSTANSYTGTTTVNAGTLNATDGVGLPTASALVLSGGALGTAGTFTRGIGTSAGQVALSGVGGFNAIGGDLVVALGGTTAPTQLTVGASGFTSAVMTLNFSTATGTTNFRNDIDLAGTTTFGVSGNSTTVANSSVLSGNITDSIGNGSFTKAGVSLLTLTGTNSYGGTTNINGGTLRANEGTSLSSSTNLNLNGGVLGTSGNFARSLGTGAGQVQFGPGTSGLSAEGGDLTVSIGGVGNPTALVWGTTSNFNPAGLTLNGAYSTGTTTLVNAIDLSTAAATTTRTISVLSGTATINGDISNSSSLQGILAKTGPGTLALSGNNSYSGVTTVAGPLVVASNSALGTTTGNTTVNLTGSLQLGGGINTAEPLLFTGAGDSNANVTIATLTNTATSQGAIRSTAGTNTISGPITLNNGAGGTFIRVDSGSTLNLTGDIAIVNAQTSRALILGGAGTGTASGVIKNNLGGSGVLSVGKVDAGTWTLTNVNTFNGSTTVDAGTLQLGDGTSGHDGTIATTSGVTVASGATLAFKRFDSSSAGYVISGAGDVSKSGPGTQTLTGANTYTGTTRVVSGALKANAAAYPIILNGSAGVDFSNAGAKLLLDYSGGSSPIGSIKTILDAGYAANFASGQLRGTARPANTTLGYGDNGTDTVTVVVTIGGDSNLDGKVDFNDFLVLQNNFGAPGTRFDQGNYNYDGQTDFNDFLVLQNNFGQSAVGTPVSVSVAEVAALTAFATSDARLVPEPASLAAVGLGTAAVLRRRRGTQVAHG